METNNNITNPDYMLRNAMKRTETPSHELLNNVRYSTVKERPALRSFYRGRRIIAIAAVIMTFFTISTIAIATNTFGLRDLIILQQDYIVTFDGFSGTEEQYREMNPNGTLDDFTVPMNELLLSGIVGSPEYEAAMEWRTRDFIIYVDGIGYVRSDKKTGSIINNETGEYVAKGIMIIDSHESLKSMPSNEANDYIIIVRDDLDDIPEIYRWYGALTQIDVDIINEITKKYGLILYGNLVNYYNENMSWGEFQASIANATFINNSENLFRLYPGYRWENGTFQFDGQYSGAWFQFRSSRKGTFDTVIISNIDIDDFTDEWVYKN